MNLSHTMFCPKCGLKMENGCTHIGLITTYQRTCTCGCVILCVPMEEGNRYHINVTNDTIEQKRLAAKNNIKELENTLKNARIELKKI